MADVLDQVARFFTGRTPGKKKEQSERLAVARKRKQEAEEKVAVACEENECAIDSLQKANARYDQASKARQKLEPRLNPKIKPV